MTTKQHDSKTEGRGDVLARQERMAEEGPKVKAARRALRLLLLEAPESVVRDVRKHVEEAFAELAASPSDLPAREAIERAAFTADHKSIWLSPVCDNEHCDNCRDDRTWHEDRLPICDECGAGPTQYIRADLYAAPPSQPEGVREALEATRKALEEIADFRGTCLMRPSLGADYDRAYQEGSNRAFEQAADAAVLALGSLPHDTTTPSRGLVEAAEWHEEQASSVEKLPVNDITLAQWHRLCAAELRRIS